MQARKFNFEKRLKTRKNHILRLKNVIFERFKAFSNFNFLACSTRLYITSSLTIDVLYRSLSQFVKAITLSQFILPVSYQSFSVRVLRF